MALSVKYRYSNYIPFRPFIEQQIQNRTESIVNPSLDFISKEDKILDIGAGAGWIAEGIREKTGVSVTLLDMVDFNQTDLELVLYDGKHIPFDDNSFDCVLLNFVLHHADNPSGLLEEAKRVTKKKIIIFEDVYLTKIDKLFLCAFDYLSNLPSFLVSSFAENMPFAFKKTSEWQELFKSLGLVFLHESEYSGKFVRHARFVLEKQANNLTSFSE